MYIEELLKTKARKLVVTPLNALKHHVIEEGVGTVFVGRRSECETYAKIDSGLRSKQNQEITA
jgi:hypothetical protein